MIAFYIRKVFKNKFLLNSKLDIKWTDFNKYKD
jgi:hypothetical protein